MSEYVYANYSGMVTWSGGKMLLEEGKTRAHRDHPLVKERPDLFADMEPHVDLPAPPTVERATRAPGEKRQTRR